MDYKSFSLCILMIGCMASCSLTQSNENVKIVLDKDAPQAVVSAANDLVYALKQVFPDDNFMVENNSDTKNTRCIEIVIDGNGANESFRLTGINEGKGLKVSGADALGAVYGIYALMEHYGCGFYMTYDTYPVPEEGLWVPPKEDFSDAPLIRERYSFNWHNFLSGCSGWDLDQWISWIDQCRKMRYNVIMVHSYGNNPMFTFEFKGITKPSGVLSSTNRGRDWGTAHVNDVRRMIGGELFSEPVFGAPQALVPEEKQVEEVQTMMKQVFAHAKAQGMKIAFQIDVDTWSSNPPEMIETLPANAKFKVGNEYRPLPDTPEGKEFYTAILNKLFDLYPELTSVVVCTRIDPQPGAYDVNVFPDDWKKEFNSVKDNKELTNKQRLAGYLWTGKVVKAFQEIMKETGRGDVMISQASWKFKDWVPYADACSPKDVALLPLDWLVVHDESEFDSDEDLAWVRRLTDSGRRIIPIIWSHHDDGQYLGRTYIPYKSFASHLEQAGCDSYGIIHWLLRPHGLYFKSHSVQVWKSTKDQPLEETCLIMARNIFGAEGEKTGGEYLLDWVQTSPIYGRETSDFMVDRPFTVEKFDAVIQESKRRMELLSKISLPPNHPSAEQHLAYWKGMEEFTLQFWNDETALQQSVEAMKKGDNAAAKEFLDRANPANTIKSYASYASHLGIISGDLGLLTLMNLKWYPAFVGQNQLLGRDSYRINFGPTYFEPLAQGPGNRSFHIDRDSNIWLVQGEKELKGEAWKLAKNQYLIMDVLPDSESELFVSGIRFSDETQIPIVPVMVSFFAPRDSKISTGKAKLLKIFFADPTVKKPDDVEFDLMLDKTNKLATITLKPGTAKVFEFELPADAQSISIIPRKGKVSICGLTVEELINVSIDMPVTIN